MNMADPLSRAYPPLAKQESGDNEEAWSITDTRFQQKSRLSMKI